MFQKNSNLHLNYKAMLKNWYILPFFNFVPPHC
uniref:Uncharacterized protein n=1 Tax=Anguilla anguilla TaxID=7936 RepID=A0A0E9VVA2_ANGAN